MDATLVPVVFFGFLLGVIDCGQVLWSHQALEERVRSAVRWGTLHPDDGTGLQVSNLILYGEPAEPRVIPPSFLGLTRDSTIQVTSHDDLLSVSIVNYQSHFFSPWITKAVISPRPVIVTAPISYRVPADQKN